MNKYLLLFNNIFIDLKKQLPFHCPSCATNLQVTELGCPACETRISGSFPLPVLVRLSEIDQQFILDFVKSSGSLKLMAQQMKLSYPTVRNLLDDIIEKLKKEELE